MRQTYISRRNPISAEQWIPENREYLLGWLERLGFRCEPVVLGSYCWAIRPVSGDQSPWHLRIFEGNWLVWDAIEEDLSVLTDEEFRQEWGKA